MQSYALTIDKFLDHAAKWSGTQEVVSASAGQVTQRIGYAALRERSNRLSGALHALGLGFGDRVGTLAWNTMHHMEAYYAIMAAGWVCHTLNPRYSVEHLVAIINEAEDRVLAVASDLVPVLPELLPRCPTVGHVIVMDGDLPEDFRRAELPAKVWLHDALLDQFGEAVAWGGFDEQTPAGLCYTSGTMGQPKGVLYTHRSDYLHTLHALQANAFAVTNEDTLLAAVPMFHANGWGLPFVAPAVGAKFVLPGPHLDGASLVKLMREEGVTVAVGVHTVWQGVVDQLDAVGGELPALKRIVIGGAKCPETLVRRMQDRLGARVQRTWGMTELSPLGTITSPDEDDGDEGASGRPPLGVDLKLTDRHGERLPEQRGKVGHLRVKGASVVDRYYKADASALDDEGYLETGDLASIDTDGNVTIRGRSKDLIKSGGEWINPAEIENIIGQHPTVGLVAVIGRPDAKWGERPVLVVEPRAGSHIDVAQLLACLDGKVARWWIPDDVEVVNAMPLAATGKIDKRRLRAKYRIVDADGE
ncbi:MAG: long-chain-fatty-acid--CoA ligase [Rhodanobacteraceae bacterium]